MDCRELVFILGEYFDGTMGASLREEFESHVSRCKPCVNFLRTYRKTRDLCRGVRAGEIPEDVKGRLKAIVLEMAREHGGDIKKCVARADAGQRRRIGEMLKAFGEGRLSAALSAIFESHRRSCPICGVFLRSIGKGGARALSKASPKLREHLADLVDGLMPGESLYSG